MSAGSGILFCAATRAELETLASLHGSEFGTRPVAESAAADAGLVWVAEGDAFAVTGAGIPHTLLRLPPLIARFRPALVVNTGIAGAYVGSGLGIGDVVLGVDEVFADLGMETPAGAEDATGEEFTALGSYDFAEEVLRAPLPLSAPSFHAGGCKRGRGATVNMCTGTDETGARRRRAFGVDFESMEGAAAALAAHAAGVPMAEVRAVSNFAARRDMRPENIRRALAALSAFWTDHGPEFRRALLRATRPEAGA